MSNPWNRILARWSHGSTPSAPPEGALVWEHITEDRLFELVPADDVDAGADSNAWTPFAFGSGHPSNGPQPPVAAYLLAVRVFPAVGDRAEFRDWLRDEHGPRQVALPGVHWLLAYEEERGRNSFLNLWGIDDPRIVDSEDWVRARDTPWWRRMAHVPANADRGVYRAGPAR